LASSSVVDLAGREPPLPTTRQLTALGLMIPVRTMNLALGLRTAKEAMPSPALAVGMVAGQVPGEFAGVKRRSGQPAALGPAGRVAATGS
jgi:hypothetical protein